MTGFQFSSADYHVNNACSPVLFYEALLKIPPNAVTIELAPHSLMHSILRRSLQKTVTNVGLMNMKAENELESFLSVSLAVVHFCLTLVQDSTDSDPENTYFLFILMETQPF